MDKRASGAYGEALALKYLMEQGYTLLYRNARFGRVEIDLILQDGDMTVFAEVKSRSGAAFGLGREAVDIRKQQRIARAAQMYLLSQDQEIQIRFDVVEVDLRAGMVTHIPNAFMAQP